MIFSSMSISKASSIFIACFTMLLIYACSGNDKGSKRAGQATLLKGLYSFGPEVKSFIDCDEAREYWVVDSVKKLELAYTNLGFERPYTPVYIEVECHFVKSDTSIISGGYDSTMVVTKLIKMSKQIPEGPCAQ